MAQNQIRFISNSVEKTQQFAECIGKSIESGIAFLLFGDLGSGKTAFVQGLAIGLEVPKSCYITSPTYTLVNQYPGKLSIFHMDLYRLNGPDDLEDMGFYDMLADQNHVLAVEWADRLGNESIENSISIKIKILDETKRSITLSSNGPKDTDLINKIERRLKGQGWE